MELEKYLVRLSLDHPEISIEELKSLVKTYGWKEPIVESLSKLYLVTTNCPPDRMVEIADRSASIKYLAKVLIIKKIARKISFERDFRDFVNSMLKNIDIVDNVKDKKLRVINLLRGRDKERSEKLINIYLANRENTLSINKEAKLILVIHDKYLILASIIAGPYRRKFIDRKPSKRPFFSPSSLDPKLALIMINLSGIKRGEVLLDPFCGVGGILVEASRLEIENIGIDIKWKWINGAKGNVMWINRMETTHLILGDGCNPPIRNVDCIVTDPPYGRISSTLGKEVSNIFTQFIKNVRHILKRNCKIVFLSPHFLEREIHILKKEVNIYLHENKKFILPVHRSLTRILRVWVKR
mgnify:CR=1 FL=1